MTDSLQILYFGGVSNCTEGALRLYLKNKGGTIWLAPSSVHYYYLPFDATDDTLVQNLGDIIIDGEFEKHRWEVMTRGELKLSGGSDMTEYVTKRFGEGAWKLEGNRSFGDLVNEYMNRGKERRF
ncbi:MAG: hypothetical protein HN981_01995 [Candidatus Pacebacteria bacterium]|jgi:hypothetical protein|nr:hypothetical protein [Candidatus Paceibacterota bacterium]MBT4652778.1 hypothetical protein [Candidatus Paceibacterota bacterium]MBT6755935.1 hypothetical protein [Candidatus Paceibacterota bacterium]MBT6921148.1 hypothetical protein [Candidatus Paceibacterota bacterium]